MGSSRVAIVAVFLTGALGCRQILGIDPAVVADDGFTPPPDAAACVDLSSTCADDSTLRTCVETGQLPVETACDFGCVPQPAHCGLIKPSGGAVTSADVDPAQLATFADFAIEGTLDTDAGTLDGGALPSGAEFKVAGKVAVFRFGVLRIQGPLTVVGTNSLAIVAEQIIVDDVIDLRGSCVANAPGPGGFLGGAANAAGGGAGGGGAGSAQNGGGGGGHGGIGGAAGRVSGQGGPGGSASGDVLITTLLGGSGAGGGHQSNQATGGGGGGAIQLVSATTIEITASGGINAGGCGGKRESCGVCTQGGGGAGGTILLEARAITIGGKLAVNGGGGAGTGGDGADASLDRVRAEGGNSGNGGGGGDGAAGAVIDGQAGTDVPQRPGGGGGGIGRIRVNTRDGTVAIDPAAILSPALDDPNTTATAGPVDVE